MVMWFYHISGRQHTVDVDFCMCESSSATLVRHRIWPGTPTNPQVGFCFGFMELLRCLRLEAHASLYSVIAAVTLKTSIGPLNDMP